MSHNPNHRIEQLENGRVRVRTVNELPSKTIQTHVQQAEMRHILSRYEQTGVLVGLQDVELEYRDVSEFTDFADVMRQGKEAEQYFRQLPPEVREAFGNDHFQWLDAAHDGLTESQARRLHKLGVVELVEPSRAPEPSPAPEPPASE